MNIISQTCLVPAALALYYLAAWLLVGRRRAVESVAVRYQPPQDLSPAAVRMVYTMSTDGRSYAAIVAQFAARGLLTIVPEKDKRVVWLEKTERHGPTAAHLSEEEAMVYKELFEWEKRVALKRPEYSTMERLHQALESRLGVKYLTRNLPWVAVGLLFTAATTTWLALSSRLFGNNPFDAWVIAVFSGLTVLMYGAAGYWLWDSNRLAFRLALRGLYRRRTLPVLLAFVLLYPAVWYAIVRSAAPAFAWVTEWLILINMFAGPTLRNYTREGLRVRDEIEGFRLFLAGTEQDRLQRMNSPGGPAQMDQEYIPYAVALDVREGWGDALGIKTMVETEL